METTKWAIDPTHSEITFKVKHLMISNVKGEFKTFQGTIDGEDFTKATISANIDASSISTNNDDRDTHLKSPDFFEVEKYPEITFVSKSIKKVDDDEYQLVGDLTIKGTTKEITLDTEFGGYMKDPYGNEKAGFSINGKLNRKDFGLNWNAALEAGGVMVGNEIKINAEVQFVKQ
ncbi:MULTISPECIES: YceI family protein [Flavobacteriaceae]|jgi:polyisoprenoid-binding protein YceI|uniref:Polyisoprenoid-binding protein n=2 Tax=Maribacter cobaltidurans TaxID=1178778 RepID=A0A223V852_9FLAO|nr:MULTISPECIES: YceI family protein [Flavobacteriaceae]HIB47754.1 polyisoprenoid-binding protein [Flavobacteriaceae bacterium]ASV31472.1 polyisoprenoid-binding protein [Maribacter cobaltidurans]MDC6391170.1 YceI family protein [Maribacter sp. PR1]MEE1978561.1 YceI family protein [Maribacter cobaltidurans]GGD97292.1 polyisoprenoid-binding protein [Maribacter cobaltidurans]|tara:strand:+ start:1534 stop:2058 length:525 start_codon:yes stop_codon:yes gene_type:complete